MNGCPRGEGNPHAIRDTLAMFGERICRNPEDFKAWSQNLGHEHVLTTFTSYGNVTQHRQDEILDGMTERSGSPADDTAPSGLIAVNPERLDRIEQMIAALGSAQSGGGR